MIGFIWLAAAFILALCVAMVLTPAVILSATAFDLYDSPDGGRRFHRVAVPRLGGVAVFLSVAAVSVLMLVAGAKLSLGFIPRSDAELRFLSGVLAGAAIMFLIGVADDIRGLSPAFKVIAQTIAASLAWLLGARIEAIALGYGVGVPTALLDFPLSILWMVGVTNAFNFIDGLDGLACGIAIVGAAAILVAGVALGNLLVVVPTIALMGGLIGFLRFNFPTAAIFLGDSGSLSVGFMLAALSLRASVNSAGAVLVVLPLLAVFVPLMDASLAIARRWLRNVPVSGADARHVHHRLLALGLTSQRTAYILWGLAVVMAGFGLIIALTAPFVAASIAIIALVTVAMLLIYGTNLLSYHELLVMGEVLMSAPSRARRVISDQILAVDLTAVLNRSDSIEDVSSLLSESAGQFGFLAMELYGEGTERHQLRHDRIIAQDWAWKLDYPLRLHDDAAEPAYVLSIWCSPEFNTRPYGAERVARILGPALRSWFKRIQADEPKEDRSSSRPPQNALNRGFRRVRK
jgi:UDP-GlcNAc:undecaprenyl-phosphate GlcNAc-1-phosphate transferase